MNQSIVTGQQMYKEISALKVEVEELYSAADTVKDDLGEDSTAYRLLVKTAQDKEAELNRLYNRKFTPYQVDTSAFEYRGGFK